MVMPWITKKFDIIKDCKESHLYWPTSRKQIGSTFQQERVGELNIIDRRYKKLTFNDAI